ncbi:hypothetical protein HBI56_147780 [Parastagonospora nodorum]|nr:hypothetical protein HBH52_071550 [Parastagonospora nodorum]KAH3995695.1 hypothetical protein HBI10_168610 [Parastagonospora nodorum]KAH4015760.1 hypothetical protein HBI13_158200 [Parastagonospora nodorum]KAH4023812.1 hypothetical protein HBI09_164330 [Parastagonospora nodorum]KAH4045777.1 hypothetical protein HBH49_195310 [Parastagonospora nodorum]
MIESLKDMKHGKSNSYEGLTLERTANQILHRMEDKDSEDSLESTRARVLSNARAIYGASRLLDVISFAPTSSRKIGAAIVEHNPTSRSYIHCCSAKEDSRLAAVEHLLVITEDILNRMLDAEGISSSGWLPATAQAQHAATYGMPSGSGASTISCGSVAGSVANSRRSSVAPQQELIQAGYINDHHSPHSHHHIQTRHFIRGNSDTSFNFDRTTPQPPILQRTASDVIQQPKPVPVSQLPGRGPVGGRGVAWKLGSED